MSVTTSITVETSNGGEVTYNITDHDPDSGLSADDIEGIIRNLHENSDSYNDNIANGLSDSGGSDNVVNIDIDNPNKDQTQVWYDGGSENNGGINIQSSDFTDGMTYAEDGTGESVQKDVDSALVHEMAHLYDKRVNDSDMDTNYADREDYARNIANEFREEMGLPEREDHNRVDDVTTDLDGDGDVDSDDQDIGDREAEAAAEAARIAEDRGETTYTKDVDQDTETGEANMVPDERYTSPDTRDDEVATTPYYNTDTGNPVATIGSAIDQLMDAITGTGDSGGWRKDLVDYTGNALEAVNDAVEDAIDGLHDDLQDLMDDYEWNNPTKLLPSWLQDLLGDWGDVQDAPPIIDTSPLVFDLDGDGVELAALYGDGSVYWDVDTDEYAEASGWVTGGDGLLAIDLNENGIIDDHSELFGTDTVDGFTILSAYDTNVDGVINANDAQWGDLLVWVDANADGYSDADELYTLDELGITEISLNSTLVDYEIEGNAVTHEGTFTINGQEQTIVDAWFAYDNTNSVYTEEYTLDVRTLFLPTLRGFGDVKDLHIAMSMDETLLGMVEEISVADVDTLFGSDFDLNGKVEALLWQWAGTQDVDPDSRGAGCRCQIS